MKTRICLPLIFVLAISVSAEMILKDLKSAHNIIYEAQTQENSIISSATGLYLFGNEADQNFGSAINKNRGDFNGDGVDDIIIAANYVGSTDKKVYIIFGSKERKFPQLSSIDVQTGATFLYEDFSSTSTNPVHCDFIGDFNGDGFDDLIIGSLKSTSSGSGKAYIVLGRNNFTQPVNLKTPSSLPGIIVLTDNSIPTNPEAIFAFSYSMACIGDFNDDGLADLAVGNFNTDFYNENKALPGRYGKVYVIFGHKTPSSILNLNTDLTGTNGFVIYDNSVNEYSYFGKKIAGLGDVNGDKIDDFIIGAPEADSNDNFDSGAAYIIFGKKAPRFPSLISQDQLNQNNYPQAIIISGKNAYDKLGSGVAGIGDINGDGLNDIVIGASGVDKDDLVDTGEAYVIFGSSAWNSPISSSIDLTSLGSQGFLIKGIDENEKIGETFSPLGDINFDGFADFLIGTLKPMIIYGKANGFPTEFDRTLVNGRNGFILNTIDQSTCSGGVGDIDGDGIPDYILGFPWATPSVNNYENAGKVLVIVGGSLSQTRDCALPYFCMAPPTGLIMDAKVCGTRASEVCVDTAFYGVYDLKTHSTYDLKTQGTYHLSSQKVVDLPEPKLAVGSFFIGVGTTLGASSIVYFLIKMIKHPKGRYLDKLKKKSTKPIVTEDESRIQQNMTNSFVGLVDDRRPSLTNFTTQQDVVKRKSPSSN